MRAASLAALLALAACGGEAQREAAATPASPACQPARAEPIPAEYHGSWDSEGGDCGPSSPTRVTVRIDGVTFHDGRRALDAGCIGDAPPFGFSRQGDRLILMQDAPRAGDPPVRLTLRRCPA